MRLGVIVAAIAVLATASAAYANSGVDARKALMKSIGGNVKGVAGYVKGENAETPADVAKRAAAIKADAGKIADAFGDKIHVENAGDVKTTASPAIWEKWSEFTDTASNLASAAGGLEMAAAGGDKAAITAAFGAMTKNCGACHKPFRVKK